MCDDGEGKWGGGIGTEGLGQSSSAPEAQMGVPYGGAIEWGSLE